jgi:hypothetical protein
MKSHAEGEDAHVFGGKKPYTADLVGAARARMMEAEIEDGNGKKAKKFDAPDFDWQMLRSTCATFLTNAHGIFGGSNTFLSARQLGHSVTVAARHYLGVYRGIPRDAHTLEAAMQIGPQLHELTRAFSPRGHLTIVA